MSPKMPAKAGAPSFDAKSAQVRANGGMRTEGGKAARPAKKWWWVRTMA